jgi:O-antigen/teichoic acid export membrane protein
MKIQEHIAKISWTAGSKLLIILYGFIQILQIRSLPVYEYGLYSLLISVQTWVFIISDSSALLSIIQFGSDEKNRPKVNLIVLFLHIGISLGIPLVFYLSKGILVSVLKEPGIETVANLLIPFCILFIPRTFCYRILVRDMNMKGVFWVDFAWLGTMTLVTIYLLMNNSLNTLQEMVVINYSGAAISSLVGVLICWKQLSFSLNGTITSRNIIRFSLSQALASGLGNVIRQLDVFIVQFYFSSVIVGIYNAAKTLYRTYETGYDAALILLYPSSVRLIAENRLEDLKILFTKALALSFFPIMLVVIAVSTGFFDIAIRYLFKGEEYVQAIPYFNILSLAVIAMPLAFFSVVIVALRDIKTQLTAIIVSTVLSSLTLVVVGKLRIPELIPLGTIFYFLIFGIFSYVYFKNKFHLTMIEILKEIPKLGKQVIRKIAFLK